MDDAGLIALARRGDAVAFSRLFAGFERRIFRYAAHMCGRYAADDVVQETFLALLRGRVDYDSSKGTVGNYLFGIARHFMLKRLSAREVATFDLDEHDEQTAWPDERPSVLDSLSREETIQAVRAADGATELTLRFKMQNSKCNGVRGVFAFCILNLAFLYSTFNGSTSTVTRRRISGISASTARSA